MSSSGRRQIRFVLSLGDLATLDRHAGRLGVQPGELARGLMMRALDGLGSRDSAAFLAEALALAPAPTVIAGRGVITAARAGAGRLVLDEVPSLVTPDRPADLTATAMGDPAPGRSALDIERATR